MEISEKEKKVGLEIFLTQTQGIHGTIKTIAEDFKVEEISDPPPLVENGDYTIIKVNEINWETNKLVRALSNKLHISRKRIKFAGTKDKKAETTRLMSLYKVSPDEIKKIFLKNVEIKNLHCSNQPLKIGQLKGNKFEIIIRNIDKKNLKTRVEKIINEINQHQGFPNFYGIQRFGKIRPTTHLVGKYLVNRNFKKAVMTYLAYADREEGEKIYQLRNELMKNQNYKEALKKFPDYLTYEKTLLNELVKNPDGYVEALKKLPDNLLTMFIYAYQSYMFNRILSERIKLNIPLNQAIEGEYVFPIRKKQIKKRLIPVTEKNIEKVNQQLSKGNAVITGILYGCKNVLSKGKIGRIEKKIIKDEKIERKNFIIPEIPNISSKGSRRPILARVKDLKYEIIKDRLNKDKKALKLKFKLRKGNYATSLLREFMKSSNVQKY